MGNMIAIAGKGGTGKTTLAALIIRVLKEENRGAILAIDADPNSNLGQLLGIDSTSTIVEIVDSISKNPDQVPLGMTKDRYMNLKLQESLNEEDGFDLLSMGRPEGPGCYCFVNNLLRDLIERLMKNYSYIVVDNEAGMEHLSRRLVRKIDMIDELDITVKERSLVLNKSKGKEESLKNYAQELKLNIKVTLPLNEELEDAAINNRSLFDLSFNNSVLTLVKGVTEHGHIEREMDRKS